MSVAESCQLNSPIQPLLVVFCLITSGWPDGGFGICLMLCNKRLINSHLTISRQTASASRQNQFQPHYYSSVLTPSVNTVIFNLQRKKWLSIMKAHINQMSVYLSSSHLWIDYMSVLIGQQTAIQAQKTMHCNCYYSPVISVSPGSVLLQSRHGVYVSPLAELQTKKHARVSLQRQATEIRGRTSGPTGRQSAQKESLLL